MISGIACIILGILIIVLGIFNMFGKINMLHSYHRNRVKKEDILPFGRFIGMGMWIIALSVIVMGVSMILTDCLDNELYALIGTVLMIILFAIGLVITFITMVKYNKGIF